MARGSIMPFMNPTFNLQSENRRPSRFTLNRDSSYRIFCACPNVDDGQHVDGLRARYSPGWRVLDFKHAHFDLSRQPWDTHRERAADFGHSDPASARVSQQTLVRKRGGGAASLVAYLAQLGGYRRRVASQGFAEEAIFDVGMCSSFGWRCCGRVDTVSDREIPYHSACNFEFLSGSAEASRRFSMVRQNELVRQ
jgi:hypothetical protein